MTKEKEEEIFAKQQEALEEEMPSASFPKQVMISDVELKELKKECQEYKDKYLRLLADQENARKRLQKERQEISQYAVESVVLDFLKPLDELEKALRFAEGMSDEIRNWAIGFQMIHSQLEEALFQNDIQVIVAKGKKFDPHFHEAIEMVESEEYPPETIVEECSKGYRMGDRTIRPARVKVAKEKKKEK